MVRELIDSAEKQALTLLEVRRGLLTQLAELLIGRETVEGDALAEVLTAAEPGAEVAATANPA